MACLTRAELGRLVLVLRSARSLACSRRERVPAPPRGEPRWSLWGWWRENDKRHGQQHSEQSKCVRVAMASAGEGMCGGLLRRALTFSSGAGSKFRMRSGERAEARRRRGRRTHRVRRQVRRSAPDGMETASRHSHLFAAVFVGDGGPDTRRWQRTTGTPDEDGY